MAQSPHILYDISGNRVILTQKIGEGGEGSVYRTSDPGKAAKLYAHEFSGEQEAKLHLMLHLADGPLYQNTAWPLSTLTYQVGRPPSGFLMPLVEGYQAIHLLYTPASRRRSFPETSWAFLAHVARNLARVFAMLHTHNIIIGDVNHANIFVSPQGLVKLIDCDSFQVSGGRRVFPCRVGVATHTPPELQGQSLHNITRTAHHDNFGLAVVIFQLLFMGRHPYAGRSTSAIAISIDQAIRTHRFPYSRHSRFPDYTPPPNAPTLDILPLELADLFEEAFSPQASTRGRPTAAQWATSLEQLRTHLTTCEINGNHLYSAGLSACPWCQLEARTKLPLFAFRSPPTLELTVPLIDTLWQQVEHLLTDISNTPLTLPTYVLNPEVSLSAELKIQKRRSIPIGIAAAICATLFFSSAFTPFTSLHPAALPTFLLAITLALSAYRLSTWKSVLIHRQQTLLRNTEETWKRLQRQWYDHLIQELTPLQQQFNTLRTQYNQLPEQHRERLMQLRAEAYKLALQKHLSSYKLHRGSVPGIGPNRLATLNMWNIYSAADITPESLGNIKGFGSSLRESLLQWRQEIVRQFTPQPANLLPPPEQLHALDRELLQQRRIIVHQAEELLQAIQQRQISLDGDQKQLQPEVERIAHSIAQTVANLDSLRS